MSGEPAAVYRERRARFVEEAERLGARSLAISIARFATFAAFALCLLAVLLHAAAPGRIWPAGAALALAAFLVLLGAHARVIRRERRARELVVPQRLVRQAMEPQARADHGQGAEDERGVATH